MHYNENINCRLHRRKIGTTHFQHCYTVVLKGQEFGHILCKPRAENILAPDFIQFQAKNHALYTIDYLNDFTTMREGLGWNWRNPIRVDIALDGVNALAPLKMVVQERLDLTGSHTFCNYYNKSHKLTGFDIGSRESNKWLTCYDKTKELERSNKTYIKKFWQKSKLMQLGNVERLELKLRKKALLEIEHFDYRHLGSFENLASIMRTQLKKMYEFTNPLEDSNVSRRTKFDFISWDDIGGELLDKCEPIPPNEVWRMKQYCKTSYLMYKASGLKSAYEYSRYAAACIEKVDWWAKSIKKWDEEFEEKTEWNNEGYRIWDYLAEFAEYEPLEQIKLFKETDASREGFQHPSGQWQNH